MKLRYAPMLSLLLMTAACSDEQKKAVNDECGANSDCADDICYRGFCAAATPVDNGQPCQGPGNCLSFNCQTGVCAPGQLTSGDRCRFKEECAKLRCVDGICVPLPAPDGGVPDMSRPDAMRLDVIPPDKASPDQGKADQALPDMEIPDSLVPDLPALDQTIPDSGVPDSGVPDSGVPDSGVPDQMIPDQMIPDQMIPDQMIPDQMIPDQTIPDAAVPYSTWKSITIPTGFGVHSVAAGAKVLLLAGKLGTGVIYRSEDGGKLWTQANLFTHTNGSIQLSMDGNDVAAVTGDGYIWVSTDAGKTFSYVHRCWTLGQISGVAIHKGYVLAGGRNFVCWASTPAGPYSVQDVTKVSVKAGAKAVSMGVALATYKGKVVGLSVGWNGQSTGWHYAHRNDGMGSTWTDIADKVSLLRARPQVVTFASTGEAFAMGTNGSLHISQDGGQTWITGAASTNKTYAIAHHVPATGPTRVLVTEAKTGRVSLNGGMLFSNITGLPMIAAYYGSAAFDGAGRAYVIETATIAVTTSQVLEGTP